MKRSTTDNEAHAGWMAPRSGFLVRAAAGGLSALLVAAAAGLATFAWLTYDADDRPGVRWGVSAAVALGAWLATGLLLAWLTRRRRPLPPGYPWLSLCPAVVAGIAIGLFCPLETPIPQPTTQSLEIIATPERNPAAKGNEVWVEAIIGPKARPVPVEALELSGDWEIRNGVPISYQRKPAALRFSDQLHGGLEVRLACGDWSGIVELVWNGQREVVDLYAPEPGVRAVTLARNPADRARFAGYFLAVRVAFALLAAAAAGLLDLVLCTQRPRAHAIDALPWSWQRLAGAAGIVTLGLLLALKPEAYFRALTSPQVGVSQKLAQARGYRDLLARHVPPGELIFSDRITSRWLPAHYDCHILAPLVGANVLIADPQRAADLQLLLAADTPWPVRCALLRKYDIEWAFINRWRLAQFGWAVEHAAESWKHGHYILVRLRPDPADRADEAAPESDTHRGPA